MHWVCSRWVCFRIPSWRLTEKVRDIGSEPVTGRGPGRTRMGPGRGSRRAAKGWPPLAPEPGVSKLHVCCTQTKNRPDLGVFPLVRAVSRSGANGIRTRGLFHAMEARYQLRHSPSAAEATRETLPQPTRWMRTQRPGRSPARRPGRGSSSSSSATGVSMPSRLILGQSRQSRSSAYMCLSSVCCTWTTTSP